MSDFSRKSVNKAVLKETVGHPVSVYPVSIGILGGLGFFLFQSPIALAAGAAGLAVGVGGWMYNRYYRYNHFSLKYLAQMHDRLRQETRDRLKSLRKELREAGATQCEKQLPRLTAKFQNFNEILDSKLAREEITYGRYLGVAEQVYLATVDNLQEAASKLKSISAIDERYVAGRLKELSRDASPKAREEEASLQDRLALVTAVKNEVLDLISDNEAAMTQLDKAAAALAGIKTRKGEGMVDMEIAMKELEVMAGRAHLYDNRSKGKEDGRVKVTSERISAGS